MTRRPPSPPLFPYTTLFRSNDTATTEIGTSCRKECRSRWSPYHSEVLVGEPDVVGFTSTFMQNVASLALARELKRRRPELTVVFGGSNCDGPMGHALHRNHPFVDHVVRGEGEYAFPALLRHLDEGTPPADVPGLCWWDGHVSRANTETRRTVAPADIPSPDYDQW